jgi:hypothetical protein
MKTDRPDQDKPWRGAAGDGPRPGTGKAMAPGAEATGSDEVRDLGFVVEDRDDQRAPLFEGWQQVPDLDTDEPLETNRRGRVAGAAALRRRGVPGEQFAADYHAGSASAEAQEEEFVQDSELLIDPDATAEAEELPETPPGAPPARLVANLYGQLEGLEAGAGAPLAQDLGEAGFSIVTPGEKSRRKRAKRK